MKLVKFACCSMLALACLVPRPASARCAQIPPLLLLECETSASGTLDQGTVLTLAVYDNADRAKAAAANPQVVWQLITAYFNAMTSSVQCNWCPPPWAIHCARTVTSDLPDQETYIESVDNGDGTYSVTLNIEETVTVTVSCAECGA